MIKSFILNMRVANKILFLFVLLLVVIIALPNLFAAFSGDQTLFTIYAEQISQGAVLYRDVWDVKQPGIFIFFLIAGKLFGFTEIGIHFFELLYFLLFFIVLIITLKDYFHNQLFASLTPLLAIGTYYATSEELHLTQVEGLVGFPIYLTIWTAIKSLQTNERRWLFLSGLCGGIVVVFKQIFLLIIITSWLTVLITFLIRNRKASSLIQKVLPIVSGAFLPVLAVLIYFAWQNELEILAYTTFVYPNKAIATLANADRTYVLKMGLIWFVRKYIPLIVVTFIGMLVFLTRPAEIDQSFIARILSNLRGTNLLTINLVLWFVVGFAVVLAQRLSWWEYHFVLFFVPLGILAAKSLEIIWERFFEKPVFFNPPLGKIIFVFLIVILLSPTIYRTVRNTKNRFNSIAIFIKERRFTPSGPPVDDYQRIRENTAFLLEQNSRTGKIFVLGHPLHYYLSKRQPGLASNGWMPEFFLNDQWLWLKKELVEKKPVYIFIDNFCFDVITKQSPETLLLINQHYRLRSKNGNDYCYEIIN